MGKKSPISTPTPEKKQIVRQLEVSEPCGPPWKCGGKGSWCGCDCYCCPPCPCYTGAIIGIILIGSPKSDSLPDGCDCLPTPTPTPPPTYSPTPVPTETPVPTPPPTYSQTPVPTETPNPTPEPTPNPTPPETYSPTPVPTETPNPTPNPSPTPTGGCQTGGCVGWYRKTPCQPCVYTGSEGAPPGTTLDVYVEPNAEFNCNKFAPYAPGSAECQPTATPPPTYLSMMPEKSTGIKKKISFVNLSYNPQEDFVFNAETKRAARRIKQINEVSSLSSDCSIPCQKVQVEVSFDGCCMLEPMAAASVGSCNFSFKAAKDGYVYVSAPDGIVGCAKIDIRINGKESRKEFVKACEVVSVDAMAVMATNNDCCGFCTGSVELPKKVIKECEKSLFIYKKMNKTTGSKKIVINKKHLKKSKKKRGRQK